MTDRRHIAPLGNPIALRRSYIVKVLFLKASSSPGCLLIYVRQQTEWEREREREKVGNHILWLTGSKTVQVLNTFQELMLDAAE